MEKLGRFNAYKGQFSILFMETEKLKQNNHKIFFPETNTSYFLSFQNSLNLMRQNLFKKQNLVVNNQFWYLNQPKLFWIKRRTGH